MADETRWLDALLPSSVRDELGSSLILAAKEGMATLHVPRSLMLDRSIASFARSALHIDLLGLFAEGWAVASEIRGYCDTRKHPAGTVSVLRLGAHRVSRDLQPEIVVHYGVAHRFPLKGGITIEGGFDGIEISIADGHITAVGSGHCNLTVRPELAGTPLCDPITIHDWTLPGRHEFSPPIVIPRPLAREASQT